MFSYIEDLKIRLENAEKLARLVCKRDFIQYFNSNITQLSPGIDLAKALDQLDTPAQPVDVLELSPQPSSSRNSWTGAVDGDLVSNHNEWFENSTFWGRSSPFGLLGLVTDAKNIVNWPNIKPTKLGEKRRPEFWEIPCV